MVKKKADKKGQRKEINVRALQASLDYLHPKNQTTKKAYETVCKMQITLDELKSEAYIVCFSVSRSFLSISIQSHLLPEICVWETNEDAMEQQLATDSLLERYWAALFETLSPATHWLVERGMQVDLETCNSVKEADKTGNPRKAKGKVVEFFIGRYTDSNSPQIAAIEKLSDFWSAPKFLLAFRPPNELPDLPNDYFIFRATISEKETLCEPVYRWTKKHCWKKMKKEGIIGILLEK